MIFCNILTTIGEAIYPVLAKLIAFIVKIPGFFRLLIMAGLAFGAIMACYSQPDSKEETRGGMIVRRIFRFAGCVLPAWLIMRYYPLESFADAKPELLAVGVLLIVFVLLWLLLSGLFWRLVQFILNICAYLMFGIECGIPKSDKWATLIFVVVSLLAFWFAGINDAEDRETRDKKKSSDTDVPESAAEPVQTDRTAADKYRNPDDMPHLNIGTFGPIDTGKTTLTAAITQVLAARYRTGFKTYSVNDLDNMDAERKRHITIEPSFAEYRTEKRYYTHYDCPGHLDYIPNMIRGLGQMDVAIFVVSPDRLDGARIREYLRIAGEIKNLSAIYVFVNKADAVEDQELFNLRMQQLESELEETGLSEIVKGITYDGSADKALQDPFGPDADRIVEMMSIIDDIPLPERHEDRTFRMPVYKSRIIPGKGMVVTGVVQSGVVSLSDSVFIIGAAEEALTVRVKEIQCAHRPRKEARPGDCVGILLEGDVPKKPGHGWLVTSDAHDLTSRSITADLNFLTREEGGIHQMLFKGAEVMIYCGQIAVPGVFAKDDLDDPIVGGCNIKVNLALKKPVPTKEGDRLIVRESGRTIATGTVSRCNVI